MSPSRSSGRWALVFLPALLVLYSDFWLWDRPGPWLGLPAGLTWHLGLCLLASIGYGLLVRGGISEGETP